MMGRSVPWVDRVRVSNYKSIAACDVTLGPLTVLLGPNGAGKSNFFDALAFVAEAVEATPSHAIDERGGLSEVLRRVPEPTDSLSITLDVTVREGSGQVNAPSRSFAKRACFDGGTGRSASGWTAGWSTTRRCRIH